MKLYHFLILGSESRQSYLAEMLQQKGHNVTAGEDYIPGKYNIILLPVPQTAKYLTSIQSNLASGQHVFGCNFPEDLQNQGEKKGVRFIDYMHSEGIASRNAIATAEGAIVEALLEGTTSIHGSHSVVIGYGRCGEVLAAKLTALHSQVTVINRKQDKRARAMSYGCLASDFGESIHCLSEADFVFNTVPAPVVTASLLQEMKKEVIIIDIASRPGGVDYESCKRLGMNAKLCPGLPGKYAPKSAAGILLEVIEKII